MVIDIQKSLLTYIYDLLTTDDPLKEAMGGTVRLYLTWASPDAIFPYLVQRIDIGRATEWTPERASTYYLDIWSDSPNADEILAIRTILMGLLDNIEFSTSETTEVHLWIQADAFVPEVEQGIWHYAMQFNLKWLKDAQIGVTLYR